MSNKKRNPGTGVYGQFQVYESLSDLTRDGYLTRRKRAESPNGATSVPIPLQTGPLIPSPVGENAFAGLALPGTHPDERWGRDVITVALLEDNRLVREGVASLLNRFPDMRVVGTDPDELTKPNGKKGERNPKVILFKVGLQIADSLQVARNIRRDYPGAGIVVMDLLPAHEDVLELISAGVSGFIMKDATLDEVSRTIRSVAAGVDVLPQEMTASLFSEIAKEPVLSGNQETAPDSVRLTAREREVITLVAEGMSNKAIGKALNVSVHTVKSHLRNIMEKLTLHSRLQIARYVHQAKYRRALSA